MKDFTLIRGDSRTALDVAGNVDFAVLSPSYPNSFDYTDIYNVELWMLGYMQSRADNLRLLCRSRSHVQDPAEYSKRSHGSKTLQTCLPSFAARAKERSEPTYPGMICAYFEDMRTIAEKRSCAANSPLEAKCFSRFGNSKYAGVSSRYW